MHSGVDYTLPTGETWKRFGVILEQESHVNAVLEALERGPFISIETHRRDRWSAEISNWVPYWIVRAMYNPAQTTGADILALLKFNFPVTLQGVPDGN